MRANQRCPALLVALILALLSGCDERFDPWQPVQGRGGAPAELPDGDDFVPPNWSAVLVHGMFDLGVLAMVLTAARLAWVHRRRAWAAIAFGLDAKLRDGPAEIAGVVEIEPGEAGAPVMVAIGQAGTESVHNGKCSHEWREADRRTVVRSFWLRLDGDRGIRIRVEPDDQVAVHAPLGRIERIHHDYRTRFVEVGEGELVRVTGVLRGWGRHDPGGIYREGAEAPVLRPPAVGPMVIDTEAHRGIESDRARSHAVRAVAAAVLFMVGVVFVAPAYHLLSLTGTRMTAVATDTRIRRKWVYDNSGNTRHGSSSRGIRYLDPHHELRAHLTLPDGRVTTLEDECSKELYECLRAGGCTDVPFVVSTLTPSLYQMGPRPALGGVRGMILVLLFIAVFFLCRGAVREDRPWYLERRVAERGDGPFTPPGT